MIEIGEVSEKQTTLKNNFRTFRVARGCVWKKNTQTKEGDNKKKKKKKKFVFVKDIEINH